jgi:hypothetical protein
LESGQTGQQFPQFLPDGQHFIYFERGSRSVYLGSLDSSPARRLLNADRAAAVSPLGFLLFARQTTLFAQVFDFRKLELSGNPLPVAETLVSESDNSLGFSTASDIVAGGPLPSFYKQQYAVSADGQRFLVNLAADEDTTSPITLIYHWKPPKS